MRRSLAVLMATIPILLLSTYSWAQHRWYPEPTWVREAEDEAFARQLEEDKRCRDTQYACTMSLSLKLEGCRKHVWNGAIVGYEDTWSFVYDKSIGAGSYYAMNVLRERLWEGLRMTKIRGTVGIEYVLEDELEEKFKENRDYLWKYYADNPGAFYELEKMVKTCTHLGRSRICRAWIWCHKNKDGTFAHDWWIAFAFADLDRCRVQIWKCRIY